MASCSLTLCLTVCLFFTVEAVYVDYYWRDYSGIIPEDAVLASDTTYIGLVYVHDHGEVAAPVSEGHNEVEFTFYGIKKSESVKKADKFIKILCSKHNERLTWLPTNAKTLHVDTVGKYAVNGGHDSTDDGVYYIGRAKYDGTFVVGSVNADRVGNARLYFVDKHRKQTDVENYEVLIYDTNSTIGVDGRNAFEHGFV